MTQALVHALKSELRRGGRKSGEVGLHNAEGAKSVNGGVVRGPFVEFVGQVEGGGVSVVLHAENVRVDDTDGGKVARLRVELCVNGRGRVRPVVSY